MLKHRETGRVHTQGRLQGTRRKAYIVSDAHYHHPRSGQSEGLFLQLFPADQGHRNLWLTTLEASVGLIPL